MENAALMGIMHRSGQGLHELDRSRHRQRDAAELLVQAPAAQQLKGKVRAAIVLADFVNVRDVGVLETALRLRLHGEAR